MLAEITSPHRAICTPLPPFRMSLAFSGLPVAAVDDGGRQWLVAAPVSSNGCHRLYCIALPSGQAHVLPLPAGVTHLATGPDGNVHLATTDGRCWRCDPATLTLTPQAGLPAGRPRAAEALPAPLPDGDAVFCLQRVGDALLASGANTGALYRWVDTGWLKLGVPMPFDPLTFTALPDGRIAGVTFYGRLVHSTVDHRMYALAPLPVREEACQQIGAMALGPDRKLYFAPRGNMRISRWDPDADAIHDTFVAAPYPGEVSALGFIGERLLIGCAPQGGLMAFYPDLPYRLLANPRPLGLLDGGCRPLGTLVHHGRFAYFATAEGALVRFDPQNNAMTAFPDVLPGSGLNSLVVDRLRNLLVAGGADGVAFWSPAEERTVARTSPFDGPARVWAVESGRVYVTDGDVQYAVLTATDGAGEAGRFPLGAITSLITTQHGELYGLAGGSFFHITPAGSLTRLADAAGSLLTEVRYHRFAFTDAGRLYAIQV